MTAAVALSFEKTSFILYEIRVKFCAGLHFIKRVSCMIKYFVRSCFYYILPIDESFKKKLYSMFGRLSFMSHRS
jgi:hypothetical protein